MNKDESQLKLNKAESMKKIENFCRCSVAQSRHNWSQMCVNKRQHYWRIPQFFLDHVPKNKIKSIAETAFILRAV